MKQLDTFIIIRRFRQQKKENNIKLKQLIKRVVQKQDVQGWSNELPCPIKKTKYITKLSKPASNFFKRCCSNNNLSEDNDDQKTIKQDQNIYVNPFVNQMDDKEWNQGSLKLDHQDSMMTQDQFLGVDDYFTF